MTSIGSLEVICGCMFSGKTEELIRRIKRSVFAKKSIKLFKHKMDTRYDIYSIITHDGIKMPTIPISTGIEMQQYLNSKIDVIGIDEVQFFAADIIDAINQCIVNGARVIVSGLDLDYQGQPFGPIPYLLSIAEKIDKLTAICSMCGAPATRSQRLIFGKPSDVKQGIISIGSSDKYEPRCRKCHVIPE